ncbi:hypothetical protein E1265_04930 [Streptomyces sp. 8K308]|nr:hypothetical protein E1265_04930 [Streptomyces sp. 8K308]
MASILRRLVGGVASPVELVAALVMAASYPLMLATALLPSTGGFAAAAVCSYLGDHFLHRRGSYVLVRFGKARLGLTIRFLIRQLLLILLLARSDWGGETVFYAAIVGLLAFYGLQAPHTALVMVLRRKRRLPITTRNIDLSTLPVPNGPPRWLTHRAVEKVLHTEVPLFLGLLAVAGTDEPDFGYAGIAATIALVLGYMLVLLPFFRLSKLPPDPDRTLEWFDEWLRAEQPTVALYFSGSKDSAYQANMWLETLEKLDEKAIVILRERAIMARLGTTTLPVVCVPSAVHLMQMDLSMLRVGLYPANVGKNLHLLRVPTMKHVFIGHGDSDKIASINPYAKAYDEVWTAGRAGRDRYALADVGVRDEDIVEVGRPQLAPIATGTGQPPAGRIPTILYAPTWEGWTDDPGNTSLLLAGENIIRRLLDSERPVRVLYKPHPFTGTRDRAAGVVHQRIVAMIEEAAARRAADPRWAAEAERTAQERARAQAALRELTAARPALTPAASWDDASVSRDAQTPLDQAPEEERRFREWNELYWRSQGWWEHRVITGPEPRLFDCFNESDALVSDISSVVSDWIASGKPYAVTDSAGLGEDEFKRQNTAVRAAVILSNDAAQLGGLLDAVHQPAADALATARAELKDYLLGPDQPPSQERFGAAVRALAARATARNRAQGEAGADDAPAAVPAP